MDLNSKEFEKYKIIEQVVNNEITKDFASNKLGVTKRQINRLIVTFNTKGKEGFITKNRGKKSKNKANVDVLNEIKLLYTNEYYDYNFTAFYEEIADKYGISYSLLFNEFSKDDIISTCAHKKTLKEYQKNMEKVRQKYSEDINVKSLEFEKLELYETRKQEEQNRHTRRSNLTIRFGEEVQMDAAIDYWFGDIISYLHLAVDKGSKRVLAGWFEYEEQTRGYFFLLHSIIKNYGIPYKIKTDNRKSFSLKANISTGESDYCTNFGRACKDLNIILETTSSPTKKSNVEKENKTFKYRLKAELRHLNIVDIDSANEYLNTTFIPKINNKFAFKIDNATSLMKDASNILKDLNLIISERFERKIDEGSAISFKANYYVPVDMEINKVVSYKAKTNCIVICAYDGTYWCNIENNYYRLFTLDCINEDYELKDTINITSNLNEKVTDEGLIYTYPINTPWRKKQGRKLIHPLGRDK